MWVAKIRKLKEFDDSWKTIEPVEEYIAYVKAKKILKIIGNNDRGYATAIESIRNIIRRHRSRNRYSNLIWENSVDKWYVSNIAKRARVIFGDKIHCNKFEIEINNRIVDIDKEWRLLFDFFQRNDKIIFFKNRLSYVNKFLFSGLTNDGIRILDTIPNGRYRYLSYSEKANVFSMSKSFQNVVELTRNKIIETVVNVSM